MYFLTIVLAVIFIICALAVEETGLAVFLVILSMFMIILSAILIYKGYKKSKNTTYEPQFFDKDVPSTVDKNGYGYSVINPIYTSSVKSAYLYLDNLKTADGKSITYKRSGAYYGVVCNGKKETAVDKYEITVSGRAYATLYICPYGKDSNKVPNGFSIQTKPLNKKQAMEKAIANSSNDDINKLCDGLETEPQTMKMAFPGGERQKGCVVRSLCKIFNINSSDALVQKKLVRIYLDVLVRKVIIKCSEKDILSNLKVNHKDLIKTETIANSVMTYIFMNMMNNDFEIKSEEDLQTVGFLVGSLAENEENREENEVHQTENLDDAEYGLVPEKPIYTNGVSGSNAYLERLTTTLGEKLSWERQGSMSVDGINGMIDIYDGYLPSGKRYKTLYVNMYGAANSATAPKGFKI